MFKEKLIELIAIATEEENVNAQIVLHTLMATILSGQDDVFASMVQKTVKHIFIPEIESKLN